MIINKDENFIDFGLNELMLYFDFNLLEIVYKNFDMKRWKKIFLIFILFVLLIKSMKKYIFLFIKILFCDRMVIFFYF